MKKVLLATSLATLTACASTAPVQPYRAAGNDKPMHISGTYNELTGALIVTIDGQPVIEDRATGLMLAGLDTHHAGSHNGHPVTADCRQKNGLMTSSIQCQIFYNAELATVLAF